MTLPTKKDITRDGKTHVDAIAASCVDSPRSLASGSCEERPAAHGSAGAAPLVGAGIGAAKTEAKEAAYFREASVEQSSQLEGIHKGQTLGRLKIGATLGRGAFGVVVAAYDPKLKRKLAIKILRPEVFESSGGMDAQRRLMREARAMARIAHANVVTVHDIGTVDGQVYVAMEFVAGGNLRDWLDQEERSWQEILDVFEQAGQGLLAAHQAGLVHRDFKPDNVLVGEAGQVRVADFGLVSISSANRHEIPSSEFAVPRGNSDELEITRAGSVMGTALYMAPEQHRGHEAGAAADQFSFCVALYWALCGKQPFAGRNYEELRDNVLAGRLDSKSMSGSVPKWLRRAIAQGLEIEPASRHENMETLLAVLARHRSAGWSRGNKVAALGLLCALGIAAGFSLSQPAAAPLCQGAADHLSGVWDGSAQLRISEVFKAADRPGEFSRLQESLDQYTGRWVSVRTRVCEATHFVGEQSETLLDLRMLCLDQRLSYLAQLLEKIRPGARFLLLDKAVVAVANLSGLGECTRSERLADAEALPASKSEKQRVIAFNLIVEKSRALYDLGEAADAEALLRDALHSPPKSPSALGSSYGLLGSVLLDLGRLEEGEKALNQSIEEATASGDDVLVAASWVSLMHLEGVERENYESGLAMARMAHLALVRGKRAPAMFANVDKAKAVILTRANRAKEAIRLLETSLATYQQAKSQPRLAYFLSALGDAKAADGQYEEAVVDYKLSLANIESRIGREHPDNLQVLNNLGVALKHLGSLEESKGVLQRSLQISERAFGSAHRGNVRILLNLANVERRLGHLNSAERMLRRAISLGNEVMEAGSPTVTKAVINLGIVLSAKDEYPASTEQFMLALRRSKESFSGDHQDIAMALNNVGESLALESKYQEAVSYAEEAVSMKTRLYGADSPRVAGSIATLGDVYAKLGRSGEAEQRLGLALRIYVSAAGETYSRSVVLMDKLGRLYEANGDWKRAAAVLRRAIAARGKEDTTRAQADDLLLLAKVLWRDSRRKASKLVVSDLREILSSLDEGALSYPALAQWVRSR